MTSDRELQASIKGSKSRKCGARNAGSTSNLSQSMPRALSWACCDTWAGHDAVSNTPIGEEVCPTHLFNKIISCPARPGSVNINPQSCTLIPKPDTRSPKPQTPNPKPQNPQPPTPTPKHQTPNPKPQDLNSKAKHTNPKLESQVGSSCLEEVQGHILGRPGSSVSNIKTPKFRWVLPHSRR